MTIKTHEEIVIAEFEPVLKLLDKVDEYITLNYDTGMSSRELGILKLRQALKQQRDIVRGEERERIERLLDECLMMCPMHQELNLDCSCSDCDDALNANSMLYEAIKALKAINPKQ